MMQKIKNISQVKDERLLELFSGNALQTSESQQNTQNYSYKDKLHVKEKPRKKKHK
jgi:hypothetical protein